MPAGQITKNCHYISRMLTKPWEGDQRRLHYYDFDKQRWGQHASYSLFAEARINEQFVETWLDQTIEQPLSIARKKLMVGDLNIFDERRFYRAAMLMLWLQGLRIQTVDDDDARRDLERLARRPMEETDQLVTSFEEEYDFAVAWTVAEKDRGWAPLYFPSTGLFPVSYRDTGCVSGTSVTVALPLGLWCALLVLPKNVVGVRDTTRVPASLQNLSVGAENARVVVVPPIVLQGNSPEMIEATLKDLRQRNASLLELIKGSKQLVADAFEAVGLQAPVDGTGRIPPAERRNGS